MTVSAGGRPVDASDTDAQLSGSMRVSATGLRVRLGGRDILDGAGITVNAGELVAVSGPSGVGKTTLLLVLAGALSPDAGVVQVARGGRASAPHDQRGGGGAGGGSAGAEAGGAGLGYGQVPRINLGSQGELPQFEPTQSVPAQFAQASAFDPLGSPDIPTPTSTGSIPDGSGGRRTPSGNRRGGSRATGTGPGLLRRSGRHRSRDGATASHLPADAGGDGGHRPSSERGSPSTGHVGFVPQTFGLAPWLTAAENVALVMQVHRLPPDVVEQRTIEALDAVGLGAAFDRIVTELSGGQRQRVAVARALAAEPAVIIADEPTAELDAENRSLVLELLLDAADAGAAVVLATHDPEVTRRCTRLLVLTEGRLVQAS